MLTGDGPYRENQRPTDTWRMEVKIRMRSGVEHAYCATRIEDQWRRHTLDEEKRRFIVRDDGQREQFHTEPVLHVSNDSGCGSRVVDIGPKVASGEQARMLFIRVSEIESLEIQMLNEREESEKITEMLRKQRERAARHLTKIEI